MPMLDHARVSRHHLMGVMMIHPDPTEHVRMAAPRIRSKGNADALLSRDTTARVERMLACYVDWREDAVVVADAYRRWSDAPAPERTLWFTAYMAALEQEAWSADSYAQAVASVERARSANQNLANI